MDMTQAVILTIITANISIIVVFTLPHRFVIFCECACMAIWRDFETNLMAVPIKVSKTLSER